MTPPDKIYVHTKTEPYFSITFSMVKEKNATNDEYIRKDELIEWAKDNLLECEVSNDETDYGRIDVYKKLIDKLNSM
jgi:hypothetical protein